jgi:hypothetical protein
VPKNAEIARKSPICAENTALFRTRPKNVKIGQNNWRKMWGFGRKATTLTPPEKHGKWAKIASREPWKMGEKSK